MDLRDVVCVDLATTLVIRHADTLMLAPIYDATLTCVRDVVFVVSAQDSAAVQTGARPYELESIVEGKLELGEVKTPDKTTRMVLVVQVGARRFAVGWGDALDPALGIGQGRGKLFKIAGISTFAWKPMYFKPAEAKSTSVGATSGLIAKTDWIVDDDATLDVRTRKLKCLSAAWTRCIKGTVDPNKWAAFEALQPPFQAEDVIQSMPEPETLESFCFWYAQWFAGDREPLLRFILSDGGFTATLKLEAQLRETWGRVHAATLDAVEKT